MQCVTELIYTSRVAYSLEDLTSFLDTIEFPVLTAEAAQTLESPITLKEVQKAIKSLQTGKTPGPDVLHSEYYKTNLEWVAPYYLSTLTKALDLHDLLASMSEAVIVIIPKTGKDPELCSFYRPISLLNVDAKILTKILANRLNAVILSLVHGDQTGFMPGKGTDINIRRLHTNIAQFRDGDGGGGGLPGCRKGLRLCGVGLSLAGLGQIWVWPQIYHLDPTAVYLSDGSCAYWWYPLTPLPPL